MHALTPAARRGYMFLSCFGKKGTKEPTWGGADREIYRDYCARLSPLPRFQAALPKSPPGRCASLSRSEIDFGDCENNGKRDQPYSKNVGALTERPLLPGATQKKTPPQQGNYPRSKKRPLREGRFPRQRGKCPRSGQKGRGPAGLSAKLTGVEWRKVMDGKSLFLRINFQSSARIPHPSKIRDFCHLLPGRRHLAAQINWNLQKQWLSNYRVIPRRA